jgi:hypothetical protein
MMGLRSETPQPFVLLMSNMLEFVGTCDTVMADGVSILPQNFLQDSLDTCCASVQTFILSESVCVALRSVDKITADESRPL